MGIRVSFSIWALMGVLVFYAPTLLAQEEEDADIEETVAAEEEAAASAEAPEENALQEKTQTELEKIKEEESVFIEPGVTRQAKKYCNCKWTADTPYTERRYRWGGYFGVQSGLYAPENYLPDFRPGTTFENYYNDGKGTLVEVVTGLKLNFFLGSFSANLSGGYYRARNERDNSTLTLLPATAGLLWALDNIFNEPYVVPYGLFGGYTVFYDEKVGGLSVSGNSPMAMFYAAGLMFQLDWIDEDSDFHGYDEYGLENTFLYVEARSFLGSPTGTDPDLSTPIQFGGGLKVEF